MIKTELYNTRSDGVKMYRTYSDSDVMIQKEGTDKVYGEAIDVENSGFIYTETDLPVECETEELTVEDTLSMLRELGVDTDDH